MAYKARSEHRARREIPDLYRPLVGSREGHHATSVLMYRKSQYPATTALDRYANLRAAYEVPDDQRLVSTGRDGNGPSF